MKQIQHKPHNSGDAQGPRRDYHASGRMEMGDNNEREVNQASEISPAGVREEGKAATAHAVANAGSCEARRRSHRACRDGGCPQVGRWRC